MGLSNEEMMVFLQGTDLSDESKTAICKLISANNNKLKEDLPKVIEKNAADYRRRKGMQF